MARKRNHPVTIWLDEKEMILLKDKVSKTSYLRSDYIRKCSLDKNITVIPGIRDLIIEFKRIGSNLDKISRLLDKDSGAQIILSEDIKSIKEDLRIAWAKLAAVMKKI
ncbi:MAG: plasmid mobilization protein [Candidatus Humimicrobiaceae bacterium]